ncbi:hypothetical protein [Photorhabdus laumondii]|uniref:hypothetical protein n=1 Tax=Photorhabdus laumondii TaxID=2218628 RepID=UPI0025B03688|nr:hypothetical protein [Photorhabdus laumondii]
MPFHQSPLHAAGNHCAFHSAGMVATAITLSVWHLIRLGATVTFPVTVAIIDDAFFCFLRAIFHHL